jgi:hypothetical protein
MVGRFRGKNKDALDTMTTYFSFESFLGPSHLQDCNSGQLPMFNFEYSHIF